MASNVLVHNGVVQLEDPGPAPAFLRSQPPGIYTTTRTSKNRTNLLLWERHLERLVESIRLMTKTKPDVFPSDSVNRSCFNKCLKSIVEPSLSKGLEKAMEIFTTENELTVTTFVTGSKKYARTNVLAVENDGLDIYILISEYICLNKQVSGRLAIMGPGRKVPNVKHSEWVRSRQALEELRPKDTTEIVLSNDGDFLLEGMVSNFFVVIPRRPDMITDARVILDVKWENIILQTAPLEGVLPGVIRKLILEICEEQGILYQEAPPSWRDRETWLEVFTSSKKNQNEKFFHQSELHDVLCIEIDSVRMIEPVGSIQYPVPWDFSNVPDNIKDKYWESLELEAPGHLTQYIQGQVAEKQTMYSVQIESLLKSV